MIVQIKPEKKTCLMGKEVHLFVKAIQFPVGFEKHYPAILNTSM